MIDLYALEAAARDATPGPWNVFPRQIGNSCDVEDFLGFEIEGPNGQADGPPQPTRGQFARKADAEYIAAANPQAVLALIARIRELEQACEKYRAVALERVITDISTQSVSGPPNQPQGEILKLQIDP